MADATFVSRRDNAFREFPPASAQLAVIVPFYGDLTVWVRKEQGTGWQFPTSTRRSGETILEVAKRELWDSARIVASKRDLLGAFIAANLAVFALGLTRVINIARISELTPEQIGILTAVQDLTLAAVLLGLLRWWPRVRPAELGATARLDVRTAVAVGAGLWI